MTDHEASRTLVKSPPELWAECSDAASLARHLGEFGEIKITRLEPETAVAWEGERATGTIRIEPSAWGTKVTLTAQVEGRAAVEAERAEPAALAPVAAATPPHAAAPEPIAAAPEVIAAPEASRRLFARLRMRFAPVPPPTAVAPPVRQPEAMKPVPAVEAVPHPEANGASHAASRVDAGSALTAALDSLGQAHHRPFSRS